MLYDLLIRNAQVIDGTGTARKKGDLAVKGDRIVAVGSVTGEAVREIDAKGSVLAPGFIDPHAHLELLLLLQPASAEYVAQGFTTVVNGNCGHSVTPYTSDKVLEYQYRNGLISPSFREKVAAFEWNDLSSYFEAVREHGGTAINHATLLGHGTLRWSVMGGAFGRPPEAQEQEELRRLVVEGLEQGAFGMSTGLAYIPSRYADTAEIVELAKIVGEYGGVYASHIRYHVGMTEATEEALEIGRQAICRVQVSHLSMNAAEAYQAVANAAAQGLRVLVDTIPQSTGHLVRGDRLIQFIMTMTPELFDVGVEGVLETIQTKAGRERVAAIEPFFRLDPRDIFVINTKEDALEMRSVADIALECGKTGADVMFDLLLERGCGVTFWMGKDRGDAGTDFPPRQVIQHSFVGPGSDILMVDHADSLSWYELMRRGCVFHFLKQARSRGLALEEAVRRMTSMVAEHFRIRHRGVLRPGAYADLVLFDPEELSYPSRYDVDYRSSLQSVRGMRMVVVNGAPVLEQGRQNGSRPGRMLKR